MLLVAVCGLNVFLLGMIGRNPREYGVAQYFGELILLGGLPLVDVLAIMTLSRRPGRRPTDVFLLGGCLALGLYLGLASIFAGVIVGTLLGIAQVLLPLGNASWPRGVGRIALGVLLS